MRINPLLLAAGGVLFLGIAAAVRIHDTQAPADRIPERITARATNLVGKPASTALPEISSNRTAENRTAPKETETDTVRPSTGSAEENQASKAAKAVRLADEVRLPAVILAINKAEKDPDSKLPQPVADAMHAIVDTFYQDLAEAAAKAGLKEDDDGTVVVPPGPVVERARNRANETYRALFGDDAFNRMTIEAALEANLPVQSGSK